MIAREEGRNMRKLQSGICHSKLQCSEWCSLGPGEEKHKRGDLEKGKRKEIVVGIVT